MPTGSRSAEDQRRSDPEPPPGDRSARFFPDLAVRVREPEIMDRADLDPNEHRAALRGLARLNRAAGSARCFLDPLRSLAREFPGRPLRVLDVACGGGDNLLALERAARHENLALELFGCDRSEVAVEHATACARERGSRVAFAVADALSDSRPPFPVDVVLNSLFVHHLDPDEVVTFLCNARAWAGRAAIVVDLLRTRLGYALACVASRLLTTSRVVRFDALVSVRAAYSLAEARALAARAGAPDAVIEKVWPERFRMVLWST